MPILVGLTKDMVKKKKKEKKMLFKKKKFGKKN